MKRNGMSVFTKQLRIVAINDVYELTNLPKLQTFLSKLNPPANAVILAGDFVSPSSLSSIDGGRGMVSTLRAAGITHACLGKHEADLPLLTLKDRIEELSRSVTVINTNMRNPPSTKSSPSSGPRCSASWMSSSLTPSYSIITTPCQTVRVALLGLMSDEKTMFRTGTFKGVPISNVLDTFTQYYQKLIPTKLAHFIIPITHQSIVRDRELALQMLQVNYGRGGVILGGHEHDPIDEMIHDDDPDPVSPEHCDYVRILKSGSDAKHASLVDLTFESTFDTNTEDNQQTAELPKLTHLNASLVDLTAVPDSIVVKTIADHHLSVIKRMENELVVDTTMVPPNVVLSSQRTRYEQTTVGAFLCQAIKEEMEADVAILNGGSIKGGVVYPDSKMSYAQLKSELPFPTKMVVISMTRNELLDAIRYSRTNVEDNAKTARVGNGEEGIPRRGYLQVDFDFDNDEQHSYYSYSDDSGGVNEDGDDDILHVALPRNLLSGFCHIEPLMEVGKRLKEQNRFPDPDDYIPALDLVTRHCCKSKWVQIASSSDEQITFEDIDLNHDGVLDREEVIKIMTNVLGTKPEDFVVDNMIKAMDADGDGLIDAGEFSYLLATMEREKGH